MTKLKYFYEKLLISRLFIPMAISPNKEDRGNERPEVILKKCIFFCGALQSMLVIWKRYCTASLEATQTLVKIAARNKFLCYRKGFMSNDSVSSTETFYLIVAIWLSMGCQFQRNKNSGNCHHHRKIRWKKFGCNKYGGASTVISIIQNI